MTTEPSTDLVVDTSALILALVGAAAGRAVRGWIGSAATHAPHLVDAEVGSVLRRRELAGDLSPGRARTALAGARGLIGHRYAHEGALSEAAWALRHNLTFSDALYVALATRLRVPLLTADARMANAPGVDCAVELV